MTSLEEQDRRYEDIFLPLLVVACREQKNKGGNVMAEHPMETTMRTALWQQFGAAIDMLENAPLGLSQRAVE